MADALRRGARGVVRPGRLAGADARRGCGSCSACRRCRRRRASPRCATTTCSTAPRCAAACELNRAWGTPDRARRRRGDRRLAGARAGRRGSAAATSCTRRCSRRRASRDRSEALEKLDPDYADHAARGRRTASQRCASAQALLALADLLAPALELGRALRARLGRGQAARGAGRFRRPDPPRRRAARPTPDIGEWIRYKLDRRFDHILVDEAQDTNARAVVDHRALTGDFFAGRGPARRASCARSSWSATTSRRSSASRAPARRTSRRRAQRLRAEMAGAAATPRACAAIDARELRELGLGRSYRTAQPVLDFVDRGDRRDRAARASASTDAPEPHVGDDAARAGHAVAAGRRARDDDDDERTRAPEDWLSEPERAHGRPDRRAGQGAGSTQGFPLAKGGGAQRRAGRHHGAGAQAPRARRADRRAAPCGGRAGGGGRPAAARRAAGGQGPDGRAALRRAAARRPQPRQPAGLAADRLEPGASARARLPRPSDVRLWDHLRAGRASRRRWRRAELLDALLAPRRLRAAAGAAALAAGRAVAGARASWSRGSGARPTIRSTSCSTPRNAYAARAHAEPAGFLALVRRRRGRAEARGGRRRRIWCG